MTQATINSYRAEIGKWVKARLLRNPNAVQIAADGLDIFAVRNVMSPAECAEIVAYLEGLCAPSTVLGDRSDPEFRTSSSADVDPYLPLVIALEERLHAVVGIQKAHGEQVQGQRYHVGQQFKPHYDFFATNEDYWQIEERHGGQRTWTAMLYLNEPEEGGQTIFTNVGVSVRPRTGNLLVWNNLTPDGWENEKAMHTGSKVISGVKYVLTKWYRERPWLPVSGTDRDRDYY